MGNFFSTYDNETPTWGSFPQDGGQHLSEMPSSFVGGGMSGPDGQKGGPGAFKRMAKRRAAMAQRIQGISGGKGDMQSSSALDMALAQSLQGQQTFLARNGGDVNDDDGGYQSNRYALQVSRQEGGGGPYDDGEPDERGAGMYPIDWRNNPHTRDQDHDFAVAIADENAPAAVPFPYDGNVHAHTDVMGATAGWKGAPYDGPMTTFPYRPGSVQRGKYQPDPSAAEYHTDMAWTPAQKLAARLAETTPEQQHYPESPKLGASLFPNKL